ncbi:hypothetical protein CCM_04956 [Cordyceps militaris CM01]|uniref:Uncharacterized protein n=1 Tax=Cordyceps militaris (strain CM01) TaxID=983644 RepID=G3JFK7_CORMM|nr:uncharacterized protein CCM_04956 [Cordyceps militaris CM01]EGX93581.1 hypothetical protein CCM_04956 [Cordyceps militaris CM01]
MRVGADTFVKGKVPAALLFWKVAYGETVPFSNGLTLGQGYNTYLNHGCRHNAVNISLKPDSATPQLQIDYQAIQITKYEQLVTVLETSAGAAVKAVVEPVPAVEPVPPVTPGASASTTASFLDKSSFEASFLTYVVKVDVQKQSTSQATYALNWDNAPDSSVYCDRFISDFTKGGALFARVDIKTTDSSKHKALEQSAKAAFSAFGANVELTQSVKSSMTEIEKSSEISMQFVYVGAPSDAQQTVSGSGNGSGDASQLAQLKSIADNFLGKAKDSEWKRHAILQQYEHVPNWSNQFKVPDYTAAKDFSWSVFKDSSSYKAMLKAAQLVSPEHWVGGASTKNQILTVIGQTLSDISEWVRAPSSEEIGILANIVATGKTGHHGPSLGGDTPDHYSPGKTSLTTTKYIAQSFETANHVSTNVIEPSLRSGATKLSDVEAFGFGTVAGSVKVAFGRSLQGESYICLPDQPMAPGFKAVSELWGMKKATGSFNKPIHVLPVPQAGVIRLSTDQQAPGGTLFTFYTK